MSDLNVNCIMGKFSEKRTVLSQTQTRSFSLLQDTVTATEENKIPNEKKSPASLKMHLENYFSKLSF